MGVRVFAAAARRSWRRQEGRRTKAKARAKAPADDDNSVTDFLKSREGRAIVNNAARATGVLERFMK